MPVHCKDHCKLFDDTEKTSSTKNLERFLNGWKWCRQCEYFKKTTDISCRCCGGMFSVTPKTGKSRRKLLAMKEARKKEQRIMI